MTKSGKEEQLMEMMTSKTAVVTGAASGIGRALVDQCLAEGMNVVLADVEERALNAALESVARVGSRAVAVLTDVARPDDVERLALRTVETFGGVHLLFNNAGVGAGTTIWESTVEDWAWVMSVNLWGVIHGIRSFVPRMLAQDEPGYVVNTASIAGLVRGHHSASYGVTKHAVVALSEQLALELERMGSKLRAAVLCPGWVNTRINESGRNRPAELGNPGPSPEPTPEMMKRWEELRELVAHATPASDIAKFTFAGLRAGKFYLLPHPESYEWVRTRFRAIESDFWAPAQLHHSEVDS